MQSDSEEGDLAGLRLLAHPLRLRLLSLLTAQAMSAAEAARELGETQANVSYHLRRLHKGGLLEVAEEVAVSGGRARRYRHVPDSGPVALGAGPRADGADHRQVAAALAAELQRRAAHGRTGEPVHLTDAELWMAPEEWRRLRDDFSALGARLHEAARPAHTPGTIPTSTTVVMFALAEENDPGADAPEGEVR
ncbi:helix-turn-helix domain-containing protein [Streptomonospora litoralis]|uniref:Helix-turn-helix domain protein n=1 Tax=Streptomonospora litoralis TaxID=2498135 RepID=A0A4P6Q4S0_9ACTN|nr:helix-turn-helix domain-containing protein [Streptomonospora litoralis]QBI55655.1 Helix-turn-helix domain protein [Streptomonospora litoralis]